MLFTGILRYAWSHLESCLCDVLTVRHASIELCTTYVFYSTEAIYYVFLFCMHGCIKDDATKKETCTAVWGRQAD